MKATIVATILAASSLVAAAPSYGTHELKHEEDDSWKSFSPINFTSVYSVKAEGDQVINTTQIPAPGQPGATGLFNYGIIGFLDIICYVCHSIFTSEIMTNIPESGHSAFPCHRSIPITSSHSYSHSPSTKRSIRTTTDCIPESSWWWQLPSKRRMFIRTIHYWGPCQRRRYWCRLQGPADWRWPRGFLHRYTHCFVRARCCSWTALQTGALRNVSLENVEKIIVCQGLDYVDTWVVMPNVIEEAKYIAPWQSWISIVINVVILLISVSAD